MKWRLWKVVIFNLPIIVLLFFILGVGLFIGGGGGSDGSNSGGGGRPISSDYANIHAKGDSLEERMKSLQGQLGYYASDGTNCVRTIGIALEGTDYGGLINTDQLQAVAAQRGEIVTDGSLRPGDIVIAVDANDSSFGHAMVAKQNADGSIGTIQNGQSANGIYESNVPPTQMFSNKQYVIIRPKGLNYAN